MALTTPQTNYYVDYSGGNDTTGDGSVGSPWKTIQKALDTITRDTTNGDRINLFDNAAHVLGAALNPTTYGANTITSPLTIAGYNSGSATPSEAEINCGGFNLWDSAAVTQFQLGLQHLYVHNAANDTTPAINLLTTSGARLKSFRCRFESANTGKSFVQNRGELDIVACHFKDWNAIHTGVVSDWNITYSLLDSIRTMSTTNAVSMTFAFNIVFPPASSDGFRIRGTSGSTIHIFNNTFYNKYSAVDGLELYATGTQFAVYNNLFWGFTEAVSSITNSPYLLFCATNYFYASATSYGGTANAIAYLYDSNRDASGGAGNPTNDGANGDLTLTAAAQDLGMPAAVIGLATTTTGIDIGAIPYASGGGRRPRIRFHGI